MKKLPTLLLVSSLCLLLSGPQGLAQVGEALKKRAQPSGKEARTNVRLMAQLGHSNGLYSAVFSPDGKQVLTEGADSSGRLWDAATGKLINQFKGSGLVFSPNGERLLALNGDETARLLDVSSGKEITRFQGHTGQIQSTAFSSDGKVALTTSRDKTARLWDAVSGEERVRFQGHTGDVVSAVFSPDGKQVLTRSLDKTVRVWDVSGGKERARFQGHTGEVMSAVFSPDGKQVLTASEDNTARLWDAISGKEIARFQGHTGKVGKAKFSPDGKQVLTASRDKTARLWDAVGGKEIARFQGHTKLVGTAVFSPDGKQVLTSGDKTARLWEAGSGKEIACFQGDTRFSVVSAVFSPNGKRVLTVGGRTARLWDAGSGKEIARYKGDANPEVVSVVFSSDGKYVLATSRESSSDGEGMAHLWDAGSGKAIARFKGYTAVFSPDGERVLTASADRTARLWNVGNGKEIVRFQGHTDAITSAVFSPDGKQVLTASSDKTARLWNVGSGKEIVRFQGHTDTITSAVFSPDGKQVLTVDGATARLWVIASGKELVCFQGHTAPVYSGVLSPDGKQVITTSMDRTSRLWDAGSGKESVRFEGETAGFSPDGKHVLTAGYGLTPRLLDLASRKEVARFEGYTDGFHGLKPPVFSPDGKKVLTAGFALAARLWDVASGKEIARFQGHTQGVTSAEFSPNGKQVITASMDSTVRLWDVHTSKELCQLVGFKDGTWAVVDPQGRYDASNGGDIDGLHWVAGLEPIALKQLKERYYDPGLLAKYMGVNKEPLREVKAFKEVKLFPEATLTQLDGPASTKLTLDLTNRGGGIGKVQVFVNGKELLADARGPKLNPGKAKARLTVDLADAPTLRPGQKNKVTIVTWNEEGYLSSRGLDLDWDAPGRKDERPIELYAILAGISEYGTPALNLRYAAKDAEDMARALEVGAKRLFGAGKVHVTLLTTSKLPGALSPIRANFEKAFAEVRKKARPDDVLFVYLAGHGVSLRTGTDQYCYLTREARTADATALSDPALLAQTAITSTELTEWVKKIPALKQVLVLDTCAAGAAAKKLTEIRQVTGDQVRAIERLKDRTGFHVLMGCAADKVSYEATPFAQGLLTHALLKGMRGAALRDEYLDVSKLFQYAADEVPQLARGIGGIQKPLIAAPRGTSFDVARFTQEDRAVVPLKAVKALVLRPVLLNPEQGFDHLKLTVALHKRLADVSLVGERGKGSGFAGVYVDAEEMPGALRPSGTYTVQGNKVTVRLRLIRDGVPVNKEPLRIEGMVTEREALLGRLVEAISRAAGKARVPRTP